MTEKEAMVALTYSQRSPFYCRSHFVFPNVSWGLGFNHELDLLSVSMPTKIGVEIEIKCSKSDLKRDLKKHHHHEDIRIRQLYFAGPIELEEAFFEFAPVEAGIITIFRDDQCRYQCTVRRNAKPRKNWRSFTDKEIMQLLRLGNMRYWMLQKRVTVGDRVV